MGMSGWQSVDKTLPNLFPYMRTIHNMFLSGISGKEYVQCKMGFQNNDKELAIKAY